MPFKKGGYGPGQRKALGVAVALTAGFSLAPACDDEGASTAPGGLGDLDANRDGLLTDADLQGGQAAIYLIYTPAGEGAVRLPIRHVTRKAYVYHDANALMCPPGWGLKLPVSDKALDDEFAVFVWFQDTNPTELEMSPGHGDVFAVSVDLPAIEHGGRVIEPHGGPLTVTSVTDTSTSGWYEGTADVATAFYRPDAAPTGQRFEIRSVAFREVETQVPTTTRPESLCSGPRDVNSECVSFFGDRCFPSVVEACNAARCGSAGCDIVQTKPSEVFCGGD